MASLALIVGLYNDAAMVDTDRIDDAVLALLLLTLHEENRVWKSFDWDAMDRLHEKGMISDPKNRNKSVMLTDEGLERARTLFRQLFEQPPSP